MTKREADQQISAPYSRRFVKYRVSLVMRQLLVVLQLTVNQFPSGKNTVRSIRTVTTTFPRCRRANWFSLLTVYEYHAGSSPVGSATFAHVPVTWFRSPLLTDFMWVQIPPCAPFSCRVEYVVTR